MPRHKHADVIIAWANGEEIEWYDHFNKKWYPMTGSVSIVWSDNYEYRIKPKVVKKEGWVNIGFVNSSFFNGYVSHAFKTKQQADEVAGERVACIRIEWEEEQ